MPPAMPPSAALTNPAGPGEPPSTRSTSALQVAQNGCSLTWKYSPASTFWQGGAHRRRRLAGRAAVFRLVELEIVHRQPAPSQENRPVARHGQAGPGASGGGGTAVNGPVIANGTGAVNFHASQRPMPRITRVNGRSRPITIGRLRMKGVCRTTSRTSSDRALAFGQERHPAEGDRRVGQDDRQDLVDHAAAPAGGPAYRPPDQEADRDGEDRELVAADLRDEVVERRADRAGDEAGAERPRERRAAGAVAVRLPDRRGARLAERLPVHVEVRAGDRLVAAGAVASRRPRRTPRARTADRPCSTGQEPGTGTRAYRTRGATARSGR